MFKKKNILTRPRRPSEHSQTSYINRKYKVKIQCQLKELRKQCKRPKRPKPQNQTWPNLVIEKGFDDFVGLFDLSISK
jgi:hypothetical protein